ncbi:MAG TPA: hypothetical protein DEB06_00715, partial [Phycisphaerales bacterium]|nr:hypothetical protein [Phycisphaerales bacterium]
GAAEAAAQSVSDHDTRGLIRLAGILWAGAAEADLRTWRSLPGEQHAAELPAPASGSVRVELLSRSGRVTASRTVQVPPDAPSLIYARSTRDAVLRIEAARLTR